MNTPMRTLDQEEQRKPSTGPAIVTPEKETHVLVEPNENDVLCGRGGSINSHAGNEFFRDLVEKRKRIYLTSRFKREKRIIAGNIVSDIRCLQPPGRFLTRDTKDGDWHDIGDEKARDKTSQALRENAPSIRAEIEIEINEQRAEIQRVEEQEAASMARAPASNGYQQQSWGQGYWRGYSCGYQDPAQHEPPPPPPPSHYHHHESDCYSSHYTPAYQHGPPPQYAPSSHHHGPPPSHPGSQVRHPYKGAWNGDASAPSPHRYDSQPQHQPSHDGYEPRQNYNSTRNDNAEADMKSSSAFDFASSVPSSIVAWTKGFSYGSQPVSPPSPEQPQRQNGREDRCKPLAFTPQRSEHKRAVHYQSDQDQHYHAKRSHDQYNHQQANRSYKLYGNHCSSTQGVNDKDDDKRKYRPHCSTGYPQQEDHKHGSDEDGYSHNLSYSPIAHERNKKTVNAESSTTTQLVRGLTDDDRGSSSLLDQVANHILTSWDTNTICAYSSADADAEEQRAMQASKAAPVQSIGESLPESSNDYTCGVDSDEGQEVELVEMMDYEHPDEVSGTEDDCMPIIEEEKRVAAPEERKVEADWSSRAGSCHHWVPAALATASLFDNKGVLSPNESILSPSASLDMDTSSSGANYPESFVDDSLSQVFCIRGTSNGTSSLPSPEMSHKMISQVPSWEKEIGLSKSPNSTNKANDSFHVGAITRSKGELPVRIPESPASGVVI